MGGQMEDKEMRGKTIKTEIGQGGKSVEDLPQ